MADRKTPSHPTPLSKPDSPMRLSFRSLARYFLIVVLPLGFVVAAVLVMFSNRAPESEVLVDNKLHTIQLDVLNATAESKLAQRMTDFLRSRGFDVVEIGNYAGDLQKTLVIDRTGNREAAVRVARSIGVPETQVIQKIDKNLYLDVSVYIGDDFQSLQPFK